MCTIELTSRSGSIDPRPIAQEEFLGDFSVAKISFVSFGARSKTFKTDVGHGVTDFVSSSGLNG